MSDLTLPRITAVDNPNFELTATGLQIAENVTYEEWESKLQQLRVMEGAIQWWIGDMLNYADHKWGEKYASAVDPTEANTWANYASISQRYDFSMRIEKLTWTHHRIAAPVEEPRRSELLEKAAENRWTTRELKIAIGDANLLDGYDGNEWYTPSEYIEAARSVLGSIDLDPASCLYAQMTVKATKFYSKADDGLSKSWLGNIWLNPPYSYPEVENFTSYLINQYETGSVKQAILLVNNCTDSKWFQSLLLYYPVCFTNGRVRFERPDLSVFATRQGQAFFYLGENVSRFREVFSQYGTLVRAIV